MIPVFFMGLIVIIPTPHGGIRERIPRPPMLPFHMAVQTAHVAPLVMDKADAPPRD